MTAVPRKGRKAASAKAAPHAGKTATALAEPAPPSLADAAWQGDFLGELRLENARIPPRFLGKTLENFLAERNARRKAILGDADSYVRSFNFDTAPPSSLLLRGGVGCGKTHVAVAILRAVIAKGYRGLYYNMVDLLADIRRTYSDDHAIDEAEFLDDLLAPDLLVIDDLGAEKTTEWVNDRLYLIVNRRYDAERPLLVTTNLMTIEEMEQKLGKRITSRLCEMCQLPFPEFPDEDFRKKHMH